MISVTLPEDLSTVRRMSHLCSEQTFAHHHSVSVVQTKQSPAALSSDCLPLRGASEQASVSHAQGSYALAACFSIFSDQSKGIEFLFILKYNSKCVVYMSGVGALCAALRAPGCMLSPSVDRHVFVSPAAGSTRYKGPELTGEKNSKDYLKSNEQAISLCTRRTFITVTYTI